MGQGSPTSLHSEPSTPPPFCATSASWARAPMGRRAPSGEWPATACPASSPARPPSGEAQVGGVCLHPRSWKGGGCRWVPLHGIKPFPALGLSPSRPVEARAGCGDHQPLLLPSVPSLLLALGLASAGEFQKVLLAQGAEACSVGKMAHVCRGPYPAVGRLAMVVLCFAYAVASSPLAPHSIKTDSSSLCAETRGLGISPQAKRQPTVLLCSCHGL